MNIIILRCALFGVEIFYYSCTEIFPGDFRFQQRFQRFQGKVYEISASCGPLGLSWAKRISVTSKGTTHHWGSPRLDRYVSWGSLLSPSAFEWFLYWIILALDSPRSHGWSWFRLGEDVSEGFMIGLDQKMPASLSSWEYFSSALVSVCDANPQAAHCGQPRPTTCRKRTSPSTSLSKIATYSTSGAWHWKCKSNTWRWDSGTWCATTTRTTRTTRQSASLKDSSATWPVRSLGGSLNMEQASMLCMYVCVCVVKSCVQTYSLSVLSLIDFCERLYAQASFFCSLGNGH